MTDSNETGAERIIREALESVERIEREGKKPLAVDATADEADQVQLLGPDDPPDAAPEPAAELAPQPAPEPAAAPKKSASDAVLEATMKAKAEMQEVLTQTQREAKDLFDRLARVSADFDNYKKRVSREKADAIKFGTEKVLKELLPVVDNMQRALKSGNEQNVLEGIKLVSKQLEDALAKAGAKSFDSLGEPFDPARHEAVGSQPHESIPAQHVAEEYQRGYMLHDRLLRPALVIVSAGPPAMEN